MAKDKTTFIMNKDKEVELKEGFTVVFTFAGKEDYKDAEGFPILDLEGQEAFSSPDAHAILSNNGNTERYYVKRGRYGRLYNPIGLYSEGTSRKQMRHAGKPEWTFQKTTKKVFDNYVQFLKTRNAAWLNNAERE